MIAKLQAGDYTALINSERGANCISLRNSKYKAIILREPNKSGALDNPYLYGMPILYPVNRISGGCFRFEGRIYKFPINEPETNCHLHGMLHEMEFEITERCTSFVKCVFEKPYIDFPHSFRIEMTTGCLRMVWSKEQKSLISRKRICRIFSAFIQPLIFRFLRVHQQRMYGFMPKSGMR